MSLSPAFSNLVVRISEASRTDSPVFLSGETGTGKRQAALSLHRSGGRRNARFVTINCIGISDERFELELCGSQTPDFEMNRKGALFLAERGTLYLHEVTELSKQSQSLLLRCIESGVFTPVGGNDPIPTDVRVVASSSANILASVEAGSFRTDLYHFLTAMVVNTPSLNDRLDDLPRLANLMLSELAPNADLSLSEEALSTLSNHSFSGNLVELKNILHRAVVQVSGEAPGTAIGLTAMLKAISTVSSVSSRDASAAEQRLTTDYMVHNEPAIQTQTVSYGLQHKGRWQNTESAETRFSEAQLRQLDEPALISEFRTEESEQSGPTGRLEASPNDSSATDSDKADRENKAAKPSSFRSLKDQERQYFVDLMAKCQGDKRAAAKIAGVTLRTLYRKLEEV